MSDNPGNDKHEAFIRDLTDLKDSMIRNASNDIPISDETYIVPNILCCDYLCCT